MKDRYGIHDQDENDKELGSLVIYLADNRNGLKIGLYENLAYHAMSNPSYTSDAKWHHVNNQLLLAAVFDEIEFGKYFPIPFGLEPSAVELADVLPGKITELDFRQKEPFVSEYQLRKWGEESERNLAHLNQVLGSSAGQPGALLPHVDQPATPSLSSNCSVCGTQLVPQARFCHSCGGSVA